MKWRKSLKKILISNRAQFLEYLFFIYSQVIYQLEFKLKFEKLVFRCVFQTNYHPIIYVV